MARHERDEELRREERRAGWRERGPWEAEGERAAGWRGDRGRYGERSPSEERREVMEGGDLGWPGGVRGSEGGAGYGRGLFGTAYGLYAGRPEHEPYARPQRWERGWEETERERAAPVGRGPKGYRRSDERILDDIVERMMWSGVDAADVEVKVEQGKVTLTGTVAERHDKRRIEDACDGVRGVEDVENHIRVSRKELEGGAGSGIH